MLHPFAYDLQKAWLIAMDNAGFVAGCVFFLAGDEYVPGAGGGGQTWNVYTALHQQPGTGSANRFWINDQQRHDVQNTNPRAQPILDFQAVTGVVPTPSSQPAAIKKR
jgi:hypothetical protein